VAAATLHTATGYLIWRAELRAAQTTAERVLSIMEPIYSPADPNVALAGGNLGLVLRELGDLAGARAVLERALAIFEAALGPDHPHVATTLTNLSAALTEMGDLAGARATQERALAINQAPARRSDSA